MSSKPSIPKGTRDFGPEQVGKRNFIFDTIRGVFVKYGYQPIESMQQSTIETTAMVLDRRLRDQWQLNVLSLYAKSSK